VTLRSGSEDDQVASEPIAIVPSRDRARKSRAEFVARQPHSRIDSKLSRPPRTPSEKTTGIIVSIPHGWDVREACHGQLLLDLSS